MFTIPEVGELLSYSRSNCGLELCLSFRPNLVECAWSKICTATSDIVQIRWILLLHPIIFLTGLVLIWKRISTHFLNELFGHHMNKSWILEPTTCVPYINPRLWWHTLLKVLIYVIICPKKTYMTISSFNNLLQNPKMII
jgi:hypothetical protein